MNAIGREQPTVTISGQYTNAYNTDIDQFHFGALYMFRSSDKKLRPYAAAGLGFTHFENSGMNANNTAFSYGVGGGVKYYMSKHIGFRGDARFVPTYDKFIASGILPTSLAIAIRPISGI